MVRPLASFSSKGLYLTRYAGPGVFSRRRARTRAAQTCRLAVPVPEPTEAAESQSHRRELVCDLAQRPGPRANPPA